MTRWRYERPNRGANYRQATAMRNNAAFTPLEKELMRRGNAGRKLVKQGRLEGWKALWWVTCPESEAREQAEAMGIALRQDRRVG